MLQTRSWMDSHHFNFFYFLFPLGCLTVYLFSTDGCILVLRLQLYDAFLQVAMTLNDIITSGAKPSVMGHLFSSCLLGLGLCEKVAVIAISVISGVRIHGFCLFFAPFKPLLNFNGFKAS